MQQIMSQTAESVPEKNPSPLVTEAAIPLFSQAEVIEDLTMGADEGQGA